MNEFVNKGEAERLGKRGSYRLGALGAQGLGKPGAPRPFRPVFNRPAHRGPVIAWVAAALAVTAAIWWSASAGLWFAPFAAGLVTGIVVRWGGWRLRVSLPVVVIMIAAGWGLALWMPALRGLPIGATARAIAALAGLPASAAVGVVFTLAVGVLQGVVGLWLGRALTPRPVRD